jgi:histidine triad (HIT) family protein
MLDKESAKVRSSGSNIGIPDGISAGQYSIGHQTSPWQERMARQNADCFFCKCLSRPADYPVIFTSKYFALVMDEFPIGEGHVILYPRLHVPDIFLLEDIVLLELLRYSKQLVAALRRRYEVDKIAVFTAGQEIKEHAHIHFLPLHNGLKLTFSGLSTQPRTRKPVSELRAEGYSILEEMRRKCGY